MLGYLERVALAAGVEALFVLSTRTMQWFVERGFEEAALDALPEARRAAYDAARASRVYVKPLTSQRALDAEELFWASADGAQPEAN